MSNIYQEKTADASGASRGAGSLGGIADSAKEDMHAPAIGEGVHVMYATMDANVDALIGPDE